MFTTREGRRNPLNDGEGALGLLIIEDFVTELQDIDWNNEIVMLSYPRDQLNPLIQKIDSQFQNTFTDTTE